jgi:N6-L-threonylcarbamoyladenine synthase
VPILAKRAHQERIGLVIEDALKKAKLKIGEIDAIAVTQGPGLAIALEVGIATAMELAERHDKKLIAVNHLEGHIYSPFVQNSKGSPKVEIVFPYLVLLVSGAHTNLVIFKDHLTYEVVGKTKDDAGGEAIDKAARMLGFTYPGGPVLERLAAEVDNEDIYKFPRPMSKSQDLDFSFSGLKTAFLYHLRDMGEEEKVTNLRYLASSFQTAVFDSLLIKTKAAMKKTGIKNLILAGGVAANMRLRHLMRELVKDEGSVLFPHYKYLNGDNAAMIGVVAHFRAEKGEFVEDHGKLDRSPRLSL